MAGAVVIAEAVDGLGEEFDFARGRPEGVSGGVVAEGLEQHLGRFRRCEFHVADLPEVVEVRQLDALGARLGGALGGLGVEVTQPLHLVASLGVLLVEAEPLGKVGVDMILGAGLAHGFDGLLHGEPEAVATGGADVVALHGGGAGQHDVGATGCGRPPWLVDDDGVGLLPRPQQHVDVGLLVEGIAPAPVEEMDVGVLHATPIEVVGLAGVQQHFADAGHRDEVFHVAGPLGQGGRGHARTGAAQPCAGAVAEAEAAAGQADLPQHGGERYGGPERLLAVIGTLHRPGHVHQAANRCHPAGEAPDSCGVDLGDFAGPFRGLGYAVGLA